MGTSCAATNGVLGRGGGGCGGGGGLHAERDGGDGLTVGEMESEVQV